jgi:hypothetical protein
MKTVISCLRSTFASAALFAGVLLASATTAGAATATPAAAPELSLALRGLLDDALEQGELLRVVLRIESSGEGNGRVDLAPASGTWAGAVAVEILAAAGGQVVARGTAVGAPASPRATIDRERIAGGMWIFPASATQGLARGDYLVRARLALKGGAGWSGEVSSEEVPFGIIPVSNAPERVSARTLARAQIAFSQGAFQEAARLLDAVLAKTPDDFDLLCLRADAALSGGNPTAAMICVSRAARLLSPQTPGPPPLILHEVQQRVLTAQLARNAAPASVPEWTWPPVAVLRPPDTEAAALREKAVPMSMPAEPASPRSSPTTAVAPTSVAPGRAVPPNPTNVVAPAPIASALVSAPSAEVRAASPGASVGTVVPARELADAAILADANGQWAVSARASSEYGTPRYAASQATGKPNIPLGMAGDNPDAWSPAAKNEGTAWIELTFPKPVHATEVRVRQNNAPGAIAKIEVIAADGTTHLWWEGVDPFVEPAVREIAWFAVRVPKTAYVAAKVKLTLNLASRPGYNQIDAVQLVGAAP